jgi:hypothetical protein
MAEECEGKVANLLASLDNLPSGDVDGKIEVLVEIVELQQKEIEDLQGQLDEHEEDYVHVEKPFWEVEKEAKTK